MKNILDELNNNLKLLYRLAIDADEKLDSLQKDGKGKFTALFNQDAGFEISAKRFKPYVLEVASDVDGLTQITQLQEQQLAPVVKKMHQLHQLLASFK